MAFHLCVYLQSRSQHTQTNGQNCLPPTLCTEEERSGTSKVSPTIKLDAPSPDGTETLRKKNLSGALAQTLRTDKFCPDTGVNKRKGAVEEVGVACDSVHSSHLLMPCLSNALTKQQRYRLFQTVNHAKVLWDPEVKPKGVFGGHLNIRSAVSKSEQLEQLLTHSNLDFLCLSETWLKPTTSNSAVYIPGYNIYRRDCGHGKGGRVMIYVKDTFQCVHMESVGEVLECVRIKIRLSPEMSFAVLVLYRPPTANNIFFDHLTDILKKCDVKEILFMGDFNINCIDKNGRKKLKEITQKFYFTQMIEKATRITKTSQTLIDLVFTNKADRIGKVYNLITGLSDHNLTLVARKRSKARYRNLNKVDINESVLYIPRKDIERFDNQIRQVNWFEMVNDEDRNAASSELIKMFQQLVFKYSKGKTLVK